MSSLIEQAALRLEQLRQAGVDVPGASMPAKVADLTPMPKSMADEVATPKQPEIMSRHVDLDFEAMAAVRILVPNAPRSTMADQYRVIKRPLIQNAMGKGASALVRGNLIMVTSALAGEGKSFTSINLAMSIAAEQDNTVMLVDADVARPSVLRMLGLPQGPGLLDLLEQNAEMSDVLLRTNVDKLTILPSGTPHARATELLASDAMSQLLEDMANRYPDRIIIFDSPPLLLTTESRVLATHMGQIVIVVHADKTKQSDVQNALATIEECPVKMMLLNQARSDSAGGYGYGYGYGYGLENEKQAS